MIAYVAFQASIALCALMPSRAGLRNLAFGTAFLLFVGLRYEVGFDWPIYKDQFSHLTQIELGQLLANLNDLSLLFGQEPGFVALVSLFSAFTPSYEVAQFCFCVLFLISIGMLAQTIGCRNVPAAMFLVCLFLLTTLIFSTARQLVALSIFNIALSFYLRDRRTLAYALAGASMLFHSSTAIYALCAFLPQRAVRRFFPIVVVVGLAASALFLVMGHDMFLLLPLPALLKAKLEYYFLYRVVQVNPLEQMFSLGMLGLLLHLGYRNTDHASPEIANVSRMLVLLCLVSLAFFAITVVRNRLFYEAVILAALLVTTPGIAGARLASLGILGAGLLFFLVTMTKATSFMFVPYRNVVLLELGIGQDDGYERQLRLDALIAARM